MTGGNTQVAGFDNRITNELRMLSAVGTEINVVKAYDASIDAWRGGAKLATELFNGSNLEEYCISKS